MGTAAPQGNGTVRYYDSRGNSLGVPAVRQRSTIRVATSPAARSDLPRRFPAAARNDCGGGPEFRARICAVRACAWIRARSAASSSCVNYPGLPFLSYLLTDKICLQISSLLPITVMKHPVNYDVFWNVQCDERPEAVTSGLTMRASSRLMTFGSCCKLNCTGTSPHRARQRVRRPVRKVKC